MSLKYYLSSRLAIELVSFFELYLKCLNALRLSSITIEVQVIICFPNEYEKILQLIPEKSNISIVTPLWVISSLICKSLQPVVGLIIFLLFLIHLCRNFIVLHQKKYLVVSFFPFGITIFKILKNYQHMLLISVTMGDKSMIKLYHFILIYLFHQRN